MPTQRLVELDILRVLAIFFILFPHMARGLVSVWTVFPAWFFGLVLFFFVSGYAIQHSTPCVDTRGRATGFLKKRGVRIYPLYWLALAAFYALGIGRQFHDVTVSQAIIEAFGAQGLLAPRLLVAPTLTLWFVGVILLYYVVYVVAAYLSSNTIQMALMMVGAFAFFLVLRVAFGLVDFRFFAYYGLFVAGVFASKYNVFYRAEVNRVHTAGASLVAIVALVLFAVAGYYHSSLLFNIHAIIVASDNAYVPSFSIWMALVLLLYTFLALVFVYASVNIARLAVPSLSKRALELVIALSFASYAVYLFHRPFYDVVTTIAGTVIHLNSVTLNILFLVGLPFLFVLCYFIQSKEKDVISLPIYFRRRISDYRSNRE